MRGFHDSKQETRDHGNPSRGLPSISYKMPLTSIESAHQAETLYSDHVNPQWVKLLNVLQMNVGYERCAGAELFTTDGRRILDFLSGYCVHNAGHNHPDIIEAIKQELDRKGPGMLQSHVPELAGRLAEELCQRAGGRLKKVFFSSSGSEGVEAAIKFSRAYTGRNGIIYCHGAFHGLTCGALSLMGDSFWSKGFGPMLPETEPVPFGDLEALERKLATKRFAAFVVEPIQSEAGIKIPPPGYLSAAQKLCQKHGAVFALDEVQTGMYRTGKFLAGQHYGADPDIVIMAKALSGGLVPVAATLMTDAIYGAVYNSLKRSIVHTSTFSENSLSMRAGLASIEVLERERLGVRATEMGALLRARLRELLLGYEMVKDIRGEGLLSGIEFTAPKKIALRLSFEAFMKIHPGMFGQVVVMRMFRDHGILTQMCGNNFLVLKAAPPLMVSEVQVEQFAGAISAVVHLMHTSHTFWSEALALAKRVIGNL